MRLIYYLLVYSPESIHLQLTGRQIGVQVRCPATVGGDPDNVWNMDILNDTGSDVQTIPSVIWNGINIMNVVPTTVDVSLADGSSCEAFRVIAEIRVMNQGIVDAATWEPLTDWFEEDCVIRDNCALLSGRMMRKNVFIASSPHSNSLFLANTKTALMGILPARAP